MKEIRYIQAINEALSEELERDEKVFIIGEDVQGSVFGAEKGLVDIFGTERIIDTPISETAIAGSAVGAAMTGWRPVADMYFSDFMYVAADEIMSKAAKWRFNSGGTQQLPVVFMATIGGYGKSGPEHSQTPLAYYMHTPGLKIAVPSTPYDAKGLMKAAIRDNNPVCYFYHKTMLGLTGEIPEDDYVIPLGKADVKLEGTDVTVVAIGYMVQLALRVAEELKGKVSVEIVDPRCLEPLDIDTILTSVRKTGRVVIVDEDITRCGATAEIGMQIVENAFDDLDAPVKRVASKNYPIPAGFVEDAMLTQPEWIKAGIEEVMGQ